MQFTISVGYSTSVSSSDADAISRANRSFQLVKSKNIGQQSCMIDINETDDKCINFCLLH